MFRKCQPVFRLVFSNHHDFIIASFSVQEDRMPKHSIEKSCRYHKLIGNPRNRKECAFLCNREFLGISYYTKNGSKLCNLLTDIRCRLSTFRPVSSIYMAPTTGSYGRSQVRRLQLPQTSQEDPGLSGVSSPLRPHHRSRGLRSS